MKRTPHRDMTPPRITPPAAYTGSTLVTPRGASSSPFDLVWFPAKITEVLDDDAGYLFIEQWVDEASAVVDRPGGRTNSDTDPAIALDGTTFAVDDIVLVRPGPGDAFHKWEIAPTTVGTGGGDSAWKEPVRAATVVAGTLATSFENGDTIDGVLLATGDRILIKNQATASENGIYTVNASGAPTRATDANIGAQLVGATVFVSEGTSNADTIWSCTNDGVTLGSTSLAFQLMTQRQAESTHGTSFDSTTTNTWEDTGANFSLPSAGTFRLMVRLSGRVRMTANPTTVPGRLLARLYNTTAGAPVNGTLVTVCETEVVDFYVSGSVTIHRTITVTAASTIRIDLLVSDAGQTFDLGSSSTGLIGTTDSHPMTVMTWERVA